MKGNKKILVIAILLLLISVGFTTYAIYRSSVTASGEVGIAAWSVKVGSTDMDTVSSTLNLTLDDITWTTQTSAVDGKIAPGSSGYVLIPIDATGSEVDVIVTAELGSVTLPNGMTATLESATEEIDYNASSMTGNIQVNIAWTGTLSDTTAKDTTDKAAAATGTVSIPLTLTARQKVAGE